MKTPIPLYGVHKALGKTDPPQRGLTPAFGLTLLFAGTLLYGILVPTIAQSGHLEQPPSSSHPFQFKQYEIRNPASPPKKTGTFNPNSQEDSPNQSLSPKPSPLKPSVKPKPPVSSVPHTQRGWQYLLKGKTQFALSAYRKALRENPKSAMAYLGLGISLKRLGNSRTATKALIQAIKLDPQSPSVLVHVGYLYMEGLIGPANPDQARRLFRQAAKLGDPFARIALLELQSRPPL